MKLNTIPKSLKINYLAIEYLSKFGNETPSETQISLMEELLCNTAESMRLEFHKKLTEREIACLFLAATGMTSEETGKLLNIQNSTVCEHRKRIFKKLKSKNMTHAVFSGIRYGYLRRSDDITNRNNQ